MQVIKPRTPIKVKDIIKDYVNNGEEGGVFAFGGRLIVRPEYQREFVYNDNEQQEVIKTILERCPLGLMCWADTDTKDANGKTIYEVLDGQQRLISICNFCTNKFSLEKDGHLYKFDRLTTDEQEIILGYELDIWSFSGTKAEKLKWFERINIAGKKLTKQELLNAIYSSKWTTDAKSKFSKTNCQAVNSRYKNYITGDPIRQDILETVLTWYAAHEGKDSIEEVMVAHQNDDKASVLWTYYQMVMNWATTLFPNDIKITADQPWGIYYDKYHTNEYDAESIKTDCHDLIKTIGKTDGTITKPKAIIEYILEGKTCQAEQRLGIRTFSSEDILAKYTAQNGKCAICGEPMELSDIHGDHIVPWKKGGRTTFSNLQVTHSSCNLIKGAK